MRSFAKGRSLYREKVMSIHFFKAVLLAALVATTAANVASGATPGKPSNSTADHSKFKELDRVFDSGPEVTKACLTCHTEAATQIHKTQHWTW